MLSPPAPRAPRPQSRTWSPCAFANVIASCVPARTPRLSPACAAIATTPTGRAARRRVGLPAALPDGQAESASGGEVGRRHREGDQVAHLLLRPRPADL